jgi:hypothetical protein
MASAVVIIGEINEGKTASRVGSSGFRRIYTLFLEQNTAFYTPKIRNLVNGNPQPPAGG